MHWYKFIGCQFKSKYFARISFVFERGFQMHIQLWQILMVAKTLHHFSDQFLKVEKKNVSNISQNGLKIWSYMNHRNFEDCLILSTHPNITILLRAPVVNWYQELHRPMTHILPSTKKLFLLFLKFSSWPLWGLRWKEDLFF